MRIFSLVVQKFSNKKILLLINPVWSLTCIPSQTRLMSHRQNDWTNSSLESKVISLMRFKSSLPFISVVLVCECGINCSILAWKHVGQSYILGRKRLPLGEGKQQWHSVGWQERWTRFHGYETVTSVIAGVMEKVLLQNFLTVHRITHILCVIKKLR